jgi:hypothetical protein
MPAASEPPALPIVPLPHTFRPFGVRIAVFVLGGLLVLVALVIWFTLPPSIRAKFTLFQLSTVVVLGLGFLALGWGLARSRVEADVDGLRLVNGYREHRYEWSEVLTVSLRPGSPWAVMDLSDGTTVSAVGIQGSDGSRATAQVRQLRRMVEQNSRTEQDD